MKTRKHFVFVGIFAIFCMIFAGCAGPQGPAGPAGQAGPTGPAGPGPEGPPFTVTFDSNGGSEVSPALVWNNVSAISD